MYVLGRGGAVCRVNITYSVPDSIVIPRFTGGVPPKRGSLIGIFSSRGQVGREA